MTSIADLRKQLAVEKRKVAKEREKANLQKQLFQAKHRKSIRVVKIIRSGGTRVGRGLGRVAKMSYTAMEKAEKKAKKKKGTSYWGSPDMGSFGY